jgi:hypothetical protein
MPKQDAQLTGGLRQVFFHVSVSTAEPTLLVLQTSRILHSQKLRQKEVRQKTFSARSAWALKTDLPM